ncbi:carbohydrate ABC transporter permease [Alteribacillus sp. HJP-4]|uniref:carbohydrate ABC transporter permease n=1 Tax=Alteribacillus sp. HJP-4 TaxID=2775394 RepID=UPI0035CD0E82
MHHRSRKWWGYLLIAPQMIGLIAFSLLPFIFVFGLSFTEWNGFGTREFVGFQNYIDQFTSPIFRTALLNTLIFSLIYIPGSVVAGLFVALALHKIKGRNFYRFFYFAPVVTSSVAVGVIWMFLLDSNVGFVNQILAVFGINGPDWLTDSAWVLVSIAILSIWWQLGFNMIIFLAGLQSIPATFYEAAEIDGASPFRKFYNITLPLLTPTIFFVTVMAVISSFQVFDQAFVITEGGPGKASYTVVYHIYERAFEYFEFGTSSAATMLLFIIILTFTLIQLHYSRKWVHYEN